MIKICVFQGLTAARPYFTTLADECADYSTDRKKTQPQMWRPCGFAWVNLMHGPLRGTETEGSSSNDD